MITLKEKTSTKKDSNKLESIFKDLHKKKQNNKKPMLEGF